MKYLSRFLAAAAVCSLLASPAQARETSIPDAPVNFGSSVRAMGMGGSMLTMPARDTSDMFYNPANLHDLPADWRFTLMGLQAGISKNIVTVAKDVINLADDLDDSTTTSSDLTLFDTFFTRHVGKLNTVRVAVNPFSMGRKDWGVALVNEAVTTISLRNAAFPNFEVRAVGNAGAGFGHAQSFLGGDLVIGALVKGIYHVETDRVITTSDIIANTVTDQIKWNAWTKAFGIGGDVGMRYRLPLVALNPVLAVVYQDIANTRFFKSGVASIKQSVNAALGIHPTLGEFGLSVEAGASQINQKRDLMTKLHAGTELRFPKLGFVQLAVRGGMNQGYPTAGLSLDFRNFVLDAAYTNEESGSVSREGKNTMYQVGATFRF